MTKVKICGLCRKEDVSLAADAGVWALGFIFFAKSLRVVTSTEVRSMTQDLPKNPLRFGVFVNESLDKICRIMEESQLTGIQLHGNESPDFCELVKLKLGLPLIKAFRFSSPVEFGEMSDYQGIVDFALLESAPEGQWGGSGKTGDWALAWKFREQSKIPVILSGGLKPENIHEAFKTVSPYALDLSSGVEAGARKKDPQKINSLFEELKK